MAHGGTADVQRAFSELVAAIQTGTGWKQAKLAREMGVSASTLSGSISGARTLSAETVTKLLITAERNNDGSPRQRWWPEQATWILEQLNGAAATKALVQSATTTSRAAEGPFIGRHDAQVLFQTLTNDVGDQLHTRLLVVHGDGGHGKTRLLQRLEEAATAQGALVISAAVQPESGPLDVTAQWASATPSGQTPSYAAALHRHLSDVRDAAERQTESDRGMPLITGAVGDGRQLLDASGRLAPSQRLLQISLGAVVDSFFDDLNAIANTYRRVVVVLDDYHRASNELDQWVRAILRRKTPVPRRSLFVVATRKPLAQLSQEWIQFDAAITAVPVTPFTEAEIRTYLQASNIDSNTSVSLVMSVTGGVPWLVSKAAAILTRKPSATRQELTRGTRGILVPRALSHLALADDSVIEVLNCASILRAFDQELLVSVLGRDIDSELSTIATQTNMFEPVAAGWQIHEAVADQARADLKARKPAEFKRMCEQASIALDERAKTTRADPIAAFQFLVRRVAVTSLHDVDEAMRLLTEDTTYLRGVSIGVGNPIANLLHAVALSAPDIAAHPEFIALSGVIRLAAGEIDHSYAALEGLLREDDPRLSERTRLVVLSALVDACHRRGNVRDAVKWCRDGDEVAYAAQDLEAEALFRVRRAETLGILGETAACMTTLAEAEALLEQLGNGAVAAEGWIVAGYVHSARGDSQAAIRTANKAVDRAPRLHKSVIAALRNNLVAWAHTLDGDVEAGIPSALHAMDFFSNDLEDAYHLAVVALNLGELHLAAAETSECLKALDLAKRCFADIDGRAFRLCELADRTTALLSEDRYSEVVRLIQTTLDDPSTPRDDAYNLGRVLLNKAIAEHRGSAQAPGFLDDAQVAFELLREYGRGRHIAELWQRRAHADADGLRASAQQCGIDGYWDLAAAAYTSLAELASNDSHRISGSSELIMTAIDSALKFNVFLASSTYTGLRDRFFAQWGSIAREAGRSPALLDALVADWAREAQRPRARDRQIRFLNRQLELQ